MRLRSCNPEAFYPVASPVAHTFAGFWTFLLLTSRLKVRLVTACRQYLPQLILLMVLANLADVDFLFGIHRGFTHSLAIAVLVALAVSCLWRIAGTFWRSAALYFLAYGSHLVIDLFTGASLGWNGSGSGIDLFWPWKKDFSSPLILIVGVKHKDLPALFSKDNLQSSLYELLIFGAITAVLVALWVRHQRKNRTWSHERETSARAVYNSNPVQSNERIS
jgi:membrane-bound metal-dependent hydrolase YbcI (DUF457 family)